MNSKFVVVCLVGMLAMAQAAGPFCGLCTKMVKEVLQKHNRNMKPVSLPMLQNDMNLECDKYTGKTALNGSCKKLIQKKSNILHGALQAGKNARQGCAAVGLC